ncbi:DUF6912 family protein [Haloglycomyces albus]|uniref:DUF6912 family protein n=1 Tax=Haloglycomyces albus TaxID=526067 RepID=UPI0012EC89F1|nr:hypothetical protein [Haloglycomyces albus]
MSRIHVPANGEMLRELLDRGQVQLDAPVYLVTSALTQAFPKAAREDLEYTAFAEAAQASIDLVSRDHPRRVVVSADLPDRFLREIPETAAAEASGSVKLPKVAAIHVDDAEVAATIRAELTEGSVDAEALEERILDWYHPSELAVVLDELFGIKSP